MRYTKFILSADWHIRSSNPEYRIDNYEQSLLEKVVYFVYLCNKYEAAGIVAGDIFHNIRIGIRTVNKLTKILKKCNHPIYTVPGQHDLEHHSADMEPTPYLNLMNSEVIINVGGTCIDGIHGAGWKDDFNEDHPVGRNDIIVLHHTVTPGDPAFFLTEGTSAEDVMNELSQFKYIICGDYHTPHMTRTKDKRTLVNCGNIGRSSIDQVDYQPYFYILDTDKDSVEKIGIPIKPSSEVFKIPENTKRLEEEFSSHIQAILASANNTEEKPNFIATVRLIMKASDCTDRQKEIAEKYYLESMDV